MRKELDFPELEQGTKIRAKYLRALEDEAFDQHPGPTYVKGFLRTYAEYLGLDGQLYVDEYNVRHGTGDEVLERGLRTTPASRPRTRQRRRRRKLESNVVWFTWGPARAGGLLVRAVKGDTLLIVRMGSDSGKQVYQGTLAKGTVQRFGTRKGLWVYLGSPENVRMKLNGSDVPVGGGQPRSLIVPASSR